MSNSQFAIRNLKLSGRLFIRILLTWYRSHGRDLPWRKTRDPYKVLVSEIMLQQTQVDRVKWKYKEFLKKYPTARHLAKANSRTVKKDWYPLGYNNRPLRLQSMVREVVEEYGGKIPSSPEELQKFKGIGPYTAGAVAAFAFGQAVPLVDTNVRRVLHRVFIKRGDPKTDRRLEGRIWRLAGDLVGQSQKSSIRNPKSATPKGVTFNRSPRGAIRNASYDFNQALMDFGATMCSARNPKCAICPMKGFCKSA